MTRFLKIIIIILVAIGSHYSINAVDRIPITVENTLEGAPITMGIPFPQGVLMSPDHVRLLDKQGREIPCQTTLVNTWEPLDFSVKWMWVFFFADGVGEYTLEYGADVIKAPITGDIIKIKNAQRTLQDSYVETGPLRFTINKSSGGFIDDVLLDLDRDGFDEKDKIAFAKGGRGSFLDILDELGIDSSTAVVHRTIREKGSGPLHAILRLEGDYTYNREDNRTSPFIIRIHLFAGKSYIRVFHTLTYTGVADKHKPTSGEHANIAMGGADELVNDEESNDKGWMEPNDQIASVGLSLEYNFKDGIKYTSGYNSGKWYAPGKALVYSQKLKENGSVSIFQNGPKPNRLPPVPNSGLEQRIEGFNADIRIDGVKKKEFESAEGWADLSNEKWGISIGIKNFLKEYPKEINFEMKGQHAIAYLWSPSADPMSFERATLDRDEGMIANFAEGVTKTSEVVINFHKGGLKEDEMKKTMQYFLDPPVPHADPETYSRSKVYGQFSPRSDAHLDFERSLDYKFDWQFFNQDWEPWYGMFDYGDQKNIYFRDDWIRWENNEPAIDFMHWLQFMRTGDPKYYHAAEAMSRHTMDVDNVHWPTGPKYYGDTNDAIDFWKMESKIESEATPYLGIGRRHASQHWTALLSAHVWVEGWIASYNLTGYHRGLDIARLTADSHIRRLWGEHGLTGRRLYLTVWNLVEAWDATKDPRYLADLEDRVDRMLYLQNGPDQYDNLVIDRYGYSQIYASHGLYKYYQLTKDERVRQALIRHARAVRDNPPYNHEYESYLATIHSLLVGYEFTKEKSFFDEALHRSEVLKVDELKNTFEELGTQKAIGNALTAVSHLPVQGVLSPKSRWVENWNILQGIRVFGWTHIYNLPWLVHWLEESAKSEEGGDR